MNSKNNSKNSEFEPIKIKFDKKTPVGGAYAIFYNYDENYNACKPEDAYWIHIYVFNSKDECIQHTIGFGSKAPKLEYK